MNLTVTSLIYSAMRKIGVMAKSETPTADEMNDALQALNLMLESWSARSLMVRGTIRESFPLTAGVASYTIGPTGTFITSKPVAIDQAFVRDTSNLDTGMDVVTLQEYNDYQDKAIATGRPIALSYDPGAAQQANQLGTIMVYYIPDASTAYTLFIESQKPLTDFATITDAVTFEPQYAEAIVYNLALRLHPEYFDDGRPISPLLLASARAAMCVLEKSNAVQPISAMDVPGRKAVYNIYSDIYN